MTNPSNAVEKPATGCGCKRNMYGKVDMCPEGRRLSRVALQEAERATQMWGRCALSDEEWKDFDTAYHAWRAHIEASNG